MGMRLKPIGVWVSAVVFGVILADGVRAAESGDDEVGTEPRRAAVQTVQADPDQPEPLPRPVVRRGDGQEPTAEEMREMMQGVMGPMMAEMMSSMLQSMARTLAEPQIAQDLATFTRNYYRALVDRGFSDEEAMRIVTSTGFPSIGGRQ